MNNNFDDYYKSKSDYKILMKLKEYILTNKQYKDIIKFLIKHKINVNSYVNISPVIYAPLFYLVIHTKNDEYIKLFEWLLQKGINLDLKLDINNKQLYIPNLYCTCNSIYLKYLDTSNISKQDIKYLLIHANLIRLADLNIDKIVLSEIIQSNNFFEELLQELMNKIELICLSKNTKTAIDNLILQYLEVFKLFNKFDTKMLQSLVNNYLLDIINYVIKSVIVLASFLQLTKAFWLSIISSFVLAMISNVCRY